MVKCTCISLYHYTVHCIIRTRDQSLRRQQRNSTSHESEMMTYKQVLEVVSNRCVNHQAKKVYSRAIGLLIATSVGVLIILIFKKTNTNIADQTNKLNK